jgi:hypothetical protein
MTPTPPPAALQSRKDDLPSVIRDALAFQTSTEMNEENLLLSAREFIAALERDKIPHVLVGGLAVLQYVDGRNTRDIDLIVAVEDVNRLPGFHLEEQNEWFATGTSGPLRVDLLFTTNPVFALVKSQHSAIRTFLDHQLRCATPEGIILLKLFALPSLYRQGNIDRAAIFETDILQLLHRHPVENEVLLAPLAAHMMASDIEALRQILGEIEARLNHARRF